MSIVPDDYDDGADLVVLYALQSGPKSVKQLRHLTFKCRQTIYKRLKELVAKGLVFHDKKAGNFRCIVKLAPVDASTLILPSPTSPASEPQVASPKDDPTYVPAPVPGANMAAATHFKVPAQLSECGVLRVGPARECSRCKSGTPLVYGETAVCAKCARVWRV